MPAMLHPRFENQENLYAGNIKPFLHEAIDLLALSLGALDRQKQWAFIDLIYRDTNRRSVFALNLANSVIQEIEQISPPDAGSMAAKIIQLSPDLGVGTISVGQLLYATALYDSCNNVAVINLSCTSYNDNMNYSPLGFQMGEYLAMNTIVSWTCNFSMSNKHDPVKDLLPGGRESETTIIQLFNYNCLDLKNVLAGISSTFDRIYKQVKIISNQI